MTGVSSFFHYGWLKKVEEGDGREGKGREGK